MDLIMRSIEDPNKPLTETLKILFNFRVIYFL